MEWVESICEAIDYIEENILEELTIAEIAKQVGISPFYFQKDFLCFVVLQLASILESVDYLLLDKT